MEVGLHIPDDVAEQMRHATGQDISVISSKNMPSARIKNVR